MIEGDTNKADGTWALYITACTVDPIPSSINKLDCRACRDLKAVNKNIIPAAITSKFRHIYEVDGVTVTITN